MTEKGFAYVEIGYAAYTGSGSVIIINLYRKEKENADIYTWSQHKEKVPAKQCRPSIHR